MDQDVSPRDKGCDFIPETRSGSQVENHCGKSHGNLKPVKPEWPQTWKIKSGGTKQKSGSRE